MADFYVWSGATGSGNGSSWANAYTTLIAALTAGGPRRNDRYLLAHDHVETHNGDITLGYGHTNDPYYVISVNRAGAVPPTPTDYLPGATLRLTRSDSDVQFGNWVIYEGIRFNLGYGHTSGMRCSVYLQGFGRLTIMRDCVFDSSNSAGEVVISGLSNGGSLQATNLKLKLGHAENHYLSFSATVGPIIWDNQGQSIFEAGSVIPASRLFFYLDNAKLEMVSCDLTALAPPCRFYASSAGGAVNRLRNCKLPDGFLMNGRLVVNDADNGFGVSPGYVDEIVNCINASGKVINERHSGRGSLRTCYTTYRNGGATLGSDPYSWSVNTDYWGSFDFPTETFEGVVFNTVTGSPKTLTVEVLSQQGALTDRQVRLEVEYLSESASLATATARSFPEGGGGLKVVSNLPASTATWTKGDVNGQPVNGTPQKVSVTFTPQRAGPIRWRVLAVKPEVWPPLAHSILIDPKATLS